jgi:lipopolysaccharide/colanic/teichoic acid biosynthesis glycosyltransferase
VSRRFQLALKRIFDVAVSLLCLILFLPLFALIALAIRLDSPGPVFFRVRAAGRWGKLFGQWKFRTMVEGAQEKGHRYETSVEDPRITRVGRILRRWSLDELPQLWNVLIGEMSLVGPRPGFAEVAERYSPEEARRLELLPGLTGWAQIHGRNLLSWPERVKLDIEYVLKFSFLLDLRILLRTFPVLLRNEGVYGEGGKVRMHHPI